MGRQDYFVGWQAMREILSFPSVHQAYSAGCDVAGASHPLSSQSVLIFRAESGGLAFTQQDTAMSRPTWEYTIEGDIPSLSCI